MNIQPTKLALTGDDQLLIDWSDGETRVYTFSELREGCECATCREKRKQPPAPASQLTVLSPEETKPLTVLEMHPVGAYAYSIHFSDGHDTGIYTFERLRELGSRLSTE